VPAEVIPIDGCRAMRLATGRAHIARLDRNPFYSRPRLCLIERLYIDMEALFEDLGHVHEFLVTQKPVLSEGLWDRRLLEQQGSLGRWSQDLTSLARRCRRDRGASNS
jgi:hypothetical protein